jgi:hypothetical protein
MNMTLPPTPKKKTFTELFQESIPTFVWRDQEKLKPTSDTKNDLRNQTINAKSNLMLADRAIIFTLLMTTDDSDDVSSFGVQTVHHVLIKGS